MQDEIDQFEKDRLLELGNELQALQQLENNGMGIGCVGGVVNFLKMGDFPSAQAKVRSIRSKVRNFPEVYTYLLDNGLREKDRYEE